MVKYKVKFAVSKIRRINHYNLVDIWINNKVIYNIS